jgi:hypothetical protein
MKHNIVYRTVCLVNNHEYTGKHETNDLNDGYLGSGKLIRRAIAKHGRENFRREILHDFEIVIEMNAKEAELVTEEYCAREDTYNLCPGGHGGWGYINATLMTPEKRSEIGRIGFASKTKEGRRKSGLAGGAARRDGLMERNKNRSDEERAYFLQCAMAPEALARRIETQRRLGTQKGKKNSQYGRPRSEETKRKISETLRRKKLEREST